MDRRRVVLPLAFALSACFIYRNVQVESLGRPVSSVYAVIVSTPVKAHLIDGSTVVFRDGIRVTGDTVWGVGTRYGLALRDSAAVTGLPLDSVVGMESFRTEVNTTSTILVSTLATVGAIAAGVAIACAMDPKCFGSCPTYYSDSAGTLVLEAEGFSYSVAQLFEARDVDRLRLRAAPDGIVRLEVRNEAFETHYINHLELLEVWHSSQETVLPDEQNRPLVVRELALPASARDRLGRDVRPLLAASDGDVYRTDPRVLDRARVGDLDDAIEIAVPAPSGTDSVALVLRLRNSLLNTILFYDIMLGDPGARSLDWVGRDLQQVGPAVEIAQWYQKKMGMQIAVRGGGDAAGFREIAHLKDTGPVAWKDVAIVVPVLERDSVRIRLSFPADNWRIDRVAVAARFRRATPVVHPLVTVLDAADRPDTTARASLAGADGRYLETSAGQRFTAEFDVGSAPPPPAGVSRTFLLASQGFYTEWVRRSWLVAPRATRTFTPSDTALAEAIVRWRVTQDTLEARFMATRVPVR
jgi:hypothetical protein